MRCTSHELKEHESDEVFECTSGCHCGGHHLQAVREAVELPGHSGRADFRLERIQRQGNEEASAQGHLQTIEQSEIEFTKDEIIEYNKTYLNLDLSQEHVQLLVERTKGWIAARGLAKSVLEINHITKDFPHPFVFASTTPYIRDNAMLEIRKYLLRKKGFSEDEIDVFILEDMFITKYQQQGFSVLED